MRSGIIFSAILHVVFVAVILFGLPSFHAKKISQHEAVVVEILPIGEFNNIKPKPKVKVVPKIRPKVPTSKAANAKPAKPAPKINTKPKMSEPAPEAPKIVKKPKPEPKIVQKDIKPIARPTPPKKEEKVVKKEEKEPELSFDSVLKTLENIEASQPNEGEEEMDFSDIESQFNTSEDYNPDIKLSITEELAIKSAVKKQVSSNWSTVSFAGAKDVHKMSAGFMISFKENGEVLDVKIMDITRYNTDRIFRSLVDSARMAILKSSPFRGLPPERYAAWKNMKFNFDPSQMIY